MPHIRIKAQEGTFEKATQDKFVAEVSNAILTAENAPIADAGAQSLTWVYFSEFPKGNVYIGNHVIDTPPIVIELTTPEGALNQENRAWLAKSINTIVKNFIGEFDNRLNHWLLMNEISEGSWASAGIVFSLDDVKTAMSIPK